MLFHQQTGGRSRQNQQQIHAKALVSMTEKHPEENFPDESSEVSDDQIFFGSDIPRPMGLYLDPPIIKRERMRDAYEKKAEELNVVEVAFEAFMRKVEWEDG